MAVIPVFVSSTFRDFHAERDCLNRDVGARLDELLVPLGCRVEMIDLRWGIDGTVDEDEAELQNRVLSVCLDELDRARPLFVALLGDRYGWVPPKSRLEAVAHAAGIEDLSDGEWSITALEVEVGALRSDATPVVFVRQLLGTPPSDWIDPDGGLQEELRTRVTHMGHGVVRSFEITVDDGRATPASIAQFEELAVETLAPLVIERAEVATVRTGDAYATAEQLFVEDRLRVVEGRTGLVDDIVVRLHQGERICLLGESGVGKSTIWAATADSLRSAGTDVHTVAIGISAGTTSDVDVATRLLVGLGQAADGPDELDAIARLHAALEGRGVVIALDGLDGLDVGAASDRLRPLVGLPPGPSVLCTTTDRAQAAVLREAGFSTVDVGPLDVSAVESVVRGLASERRRQLPESAVAHLIERERTPLWVRLAFEELLALDEDDFASLPSGPDAIADLLTQTARDLPPDVQGLAGRVMERCADRHGTNATAWVLGSLAVSRSGLSHIDLAKMSGAAPVVVAGVRRRAGSLLHPRSEGDRLSYRHRLLRSAAHRRFVETEVDWHRSIADHLLQVSDQSESVVGDRLFHTLLAHSAQGAAEILEGAELDGEGSTALAYALADALRRVELGEDDPASVLLAPTEVLGPGALDFLTWWLTHPAAQGCRATTRRQVAARAVEIARRLQPMWIDMPRFGTAWAARLRQNLQPSLTEEEITYFDWITSAEGRLAHLRLAVALRSEALMMIASGEKRLAAQQLLQQSELALRELHAILGALSEDGGLDEAGRELRREVLEQLIETTHALVDVELEGDVRRKKRLARRTGRLAELTDELGTLGPGSKPSVRGRLRTLAARAGEASHADRHDEALGLAEELLSQARTAADGLTPDQGDEEVQRALLCLGRVALAAGDIGRALVAAEENEVLARHLHRQDPADADRALTVIAGLDLLVRALGDDERAERHALELIDRARTQVAADPSSLVAQRALYEALELRGDQLQRQGDIEGATAAFDEALAIRKPMQRKGHAGDIRDLRELNRKRVAASMTERGGVLGRLADAGNKAKVVRALKPRLIESERLTARADEAIDTRDFPAALEFAKAALAIDLQVAAELARWPAESLGWIAYDHHQIGKCHLALDDRARAVEAFTASVHAARERHRLDHGNDEVTADLFRSLHALGKALVLDDRQYQPVWEEAVEVSKLWLEQQPRELNVLRGYCEALLSLSRSIWPSPDPHAILPILTEAVGALRELIGRDPEVTVLSAGFRNALRRLGEALLEADDPSALSVLDELVERERSAARDGTTTPSQERLSRALHLAVLARTAAGDHEAAERLRQEASALDDD